MVYLFIIFRFNYRLVRYYFQASFNVEVILNIAKVTQSIVIPLNFLLLLLLLVLQVKGLSICVCNKKLLRVLSCYVFALRHLMCISLQLCTDCC